MESFYTKLTGVTHDNDDTDKPRNRQAIIKKFVKAEEILLLEREPYNQYDKNAIAVYVVPLDDPWGEDQYRVGYLTGELAKKIAPLMDSGHRAVCQVQNVTGGEKDKKTKGVNVLVEVYTPEEVAAYYKNKSEKY